MKFTPLRWLLVFVRPHRTRLWIGLILATFTSVLTLFIPSLAGSLLDEASPATRSITLTYGVLVIGLLMGRTVCGFTSSYALGTAAARTVTHLRQGFMTRLVSAPIPFHDRHPSAGLVAALTVDTSFVEQSLNSLLPALAQHGPVIVIGTILALRINPTLALTLIGVSVPFILVMGLAGQRVRGIAQQGQEVLAQAAVAAQESMVGLRLLKSLRGETWALQRFGALLENLLKLKQKRVLWMSLMEAALPLGAVLGVLAVAWVVAQQLADNSLSRASLVTFVSYLAILGASARQLLSAYTGLESMLGATDRLTHLADIIGAPEDVLAGARLRPSPDTADAARGHLQFKHVSFVFDEVQSSVPTLRGVRDLSFSIAAGEVVAITGHNGAGKSTVAQLLLQFYQPQQGSVMLDGSRANEVALADWRRHFALVTRDPILFGVSICENIQLGRPGASQEDIEHAAQAVGLHAFISGLPQGYHTQVGEAGVRLSAGQRQRIALARVFLQNPAVVILDEATHSLDAESETIFWAALIVWKRNRTVIVIAHQPVKGLPVTRIIHMAHGHIVSNNEVAAAPPISQLS